MYFRASELYDFSGTGFSDLRSDSKVAGAGGDFLDSMVSNTPYPESLNPEPKSVKFLKPLLTPQ